MRQIFLLHDEEDRVQGTNWLHVTDAACEHDKIRSPMCTISVKMLLIFQHIEQWMVPSLPNAQNNNFKYNKAIVNLPTT